MSFWLFLASFVLLLCCVYGTPLAIADVKRTIDVSTSIARHSISIRFSPNKDSSSFILPVLIPTFKESDSKKVSLALLTVTQGIKAERLQATSIETPQGSPSGFLYFNVVFARPPVSEKDTVVTVEYALTDAVVPFPREVAQSENHLVQYVDNIYFLSPYVTETQETTVRVGAPVERHTTEDPTKSQDGKVVYGPYSKISPFTQKLLHVHYQAKAPFVMAEKMQRTLQVSHWGVLQVEELYNLRHIGARIKGSFSRFEYQRMASPSVVPLVTAVLHQDASDIYFRDSIGNISTSTIRVGGNVDEGKIEVDFQQRFPLFGGWQTEFYFGYNLPLGEALSYSNGRYNLSFPYCSPLKNMHIENYETVVILPEGAKNVKITVGGKEPSSLVQSATKTYLDTFGRPTFTLKDSDIISPDHTQLIEVTYSFSTLSMLREPFLLTFAFLAIFAASIFYVRFY